jgi:hypothetical protein
MSSVRTTSPCRRAVGRLVALAVCAAAVCALGAATASARALSNTAAPPCSKAWLAPAVARAGKAQGTWARLNKAGLGCGSGWAYASADVGPVKHGIAVTFVFKRSGRAWILEDRNVVCKAPGKQVPASLFKAACASN